MVQLTPVPGGVRWAIKVVPGASRTRCMGELGDRMKLAVAAPPEKGKANQAVVAFLAKALNVKKTAVHIESGETSPEKIVSVQGVTEEQVRTVFGLI